jgi:hypothetical protein
MNEKYKELIEKYNVLYSKLAVTDYLITDFKNQQTADIAKLEELKEKIVAMDHKAASDLKDFEFSTTKKFLDLENKILSTESKVTSLNNNSFIQLTNTMDLKKWATLFGIIISLLASAGVLDNFISSSFTEDQLNNKIKELIKLTE